MAITHLTHKEIIMPTPDEVFPDGSSSMRAPEDNIPRDAMGQDLSPVIGRIRDHERRRRIGGEMGIAICNLANIAEDYNGLVVEENERGPDNNAIGVIAYDDGSGVVIEYHPGINIDGGFSFQSGRFDILYAFNSPEDAEEWFRENASDRTD